MVGMGMGKPLRLTSLRASPSLVEVEVEVEVDSEVEIESAETPTLGGCADENDCNVWTDCVWVWTVVMITEDEDDDKDEDKAEEVEPSEKAEAAWG